MLGHRWKNFGGNMSKAMVLAHLHPRAGSIDVCTRCGFVWDDFLWRLNMDDENAKIYHSTKRQEIGQFAHMTGLRLRGDWR
jgi:hypothetical protein